MPAVGCNRSQRKESRNRIGRNAYVACNHRSVDVFYSDLIPVRSIVEVTFGMPMMRKFMLHCELRAEGGHPRLKVLVFAASRTRGFLGGLKLSRGMTNLRKALDSLPNLFRSCIGKVQAHESLTGSIGEEISPRYK